MVDNIPAPPPLPPVGPRLRVAGGAMQAGAPKVAAQPVAPAPADTPDGQDPHGFYPLPFKFAGMPEVDNNIPMQLQMHMNLPANSSAILEVPRELVDKTDKTVKKAGLEKLNIIKIDQKRNVAWISLNPFAVNNIGYWHIPAGVKWDMRLFVQVPQEHVQNRYQVNAVQLFDGKELGRVTWFLGQGWQRQEKPGLLYRFLRRIPDILFNVKEKPRYETKY